MRTSKATAWSAVMSLCVALCFSGCLTKHEGRDSTVETVTIIPEESDELLANPGMGWETFHRTRDKDKNLPVWIPSTVHYARWGWGSLEPQPGKINYEFLDKVLKETSDAGQHLAFRVMCCSTTLSHPYHPAWLKDAGGRILICDYEGQEGLLVPDLDDQAVLERHLDFIRRLGARYDGHPSLDHIDLGSVGWWGEWHMSGSKTGKMPTIGNRIRIIDAYVAAFRKTRLLMLIGDSPCLTYAAQHGAGWRADCLGDMGGFSKTWCHMRNAYPQLVKEAAVGDVWKTAPIAWESCWDMRKWVEEKWPLRFIFNYALALHGSYFNNKSAPLPEGEQVREEIERFLRRLGYRFVLRELKHPKVVGRGESLDIAMKWQNVGSAPCYKPYRIAYRLDDGSGYVKTVVGAVTVDKWMAGSIEVFTEDFFRKPPDLPPGDIVEVVDSVRLPTDIPAGTFRLSVGVVGEQTTEPILRLAIKGRADDDWYPLSELVLIE